jgi:hypothetical protein
MFVAMMSRCNAGIKVKEEDIHGNTISYASLIGDLLWLAPHKS